MPVLRYAVVGCLVLIGVFAYSKRDAVLGAYEWDPNAETVTLTSFDPKALADQRALPLPATGLTVVTAPDTRSVPVPTLAPQSDAAGAGVAVQGGRSTIEGTVVGPGGSPVSGATVRIERLIGADVGVYEVRSATNGSFSVGELLGGRYRIRAWRSPTHAQPGSVVAFLTDGERRGFRLELEAPSGAELSASAGQARVNLGASTTVSARVRAPFVNGNGQIAVGGRSGDVITVSATGVFAGLSGTASTDSSGLATFTVNCTQLGTGTVTVSGVGASRSVEVTCVPPPTTTTTTTTVPGAPGPGGTPPAPGSATTTTAAGPR